MSARRWVSPDDNGKMIKIKYIDDNEEYAVRSLSDIRGKDQVVYIDCSNMNLNYIPTFPFPSLEKFVCNNNKVSSLEFLKNCPKIKKVICCKNKISSLAVFSECPELELLFCNYNNIQRLTGLENCLKLQTLHICNNYIKELPDFIYDFKELKGIMYEENEGLEVSDEMYAYIEDIRDKNTVFKRK